MQIRSQKHDLQVDVKREDPPNWRYFRRGKGGGGKEPNPLDLQIFIFLIDKTEENSTY